MLLIYSYKITPRLKFVFKQICIRILYIPVSFTNVIEEFIAHDGLKMSYGAQPLGSEFLEHLEIYKPKYQSLVGVRTDV